MREEHLETSQGSAPPLMRRLLAQLHWVMLAVAVGLWGLHLGGLFLGPHPGQQDVKTGLVERDQAFRERVEGIFLNMEEETGRFVALEKKVAASFGPLDRPETRPFRELTYLPAVLDLKRRGARNEILFLPPKDLRLDVRMGSIALTWVDDGDNNVAVSEWEILRSEGDGPWKPLKRVAGDRNTYVDKAVTAGVTYGYRVLAITTDATVAKEARRTKPTPPQREAAASDIRVKLISGDVARKTAVFSVEKWHNDAWSLRQFTVQVGKPLGAEDEGSGIDYSTGRTLGSLRGEVLKETRKVQEVTFDAAGKVVVQDGRPVLEEVPVTEEFLVLTARLEGGLLPAQTLQKRQKR